MNKRRKRVPIGWRIRRLAPLDEVCPTCRAWTGDPCRGETGQELRRFHQERQWRAWRRSQCGSPEYGDWRAWREEGVRAAAAAEAPASLLSPPTTAPPLEPHPNTATPHHSAAGGSRHAE